VSANARCDAAQTRSPIGGVPWVRLQFRPFERYRREGHAELGVEREQVSRRVDRRRPFRELEPDLLAVRRPPIEGHAPVCQLALGRRCPGGHDQRVERCGRGCVRPIAYQFEVIRPIKPRRRRLGRRGCRPGCPYDGGGCRRLLDRLGSRSRSDISRCRERWFDLAARAGDEEDDCHRQGTDGQVSNCKHPRSISRG